MKFGKKIQNAAMVSTSLCREDCWMNYKGLKKLLKTFEVARSEAEDEEQKVQVIAQNDDERRFFTGLKLELSKITRVYLELERRLLGDFVNLLAVIEQMKTSSSEEGNTKAMSRFTELHGRLILLRNFAVMNYVGFTKILKKHDKLTGFQTRDKYMLRMVNDQPFADHGTLKRSLEIMESEYNHIKQNGVFKGTVSASDINAFKDALTPRLPVRSLSLDDPKVDQAGKKKMKEKNVYKRSAISPSGPLQKKIRMGDQQNPLESLVAAAVLQQSQQATTSSLLEYS